MTISYRLPIRNARMQAIVDDAGSGAVLELYEGARPSVADPITAQRLLGELPLADPIGAVDTGAGALVLDPITTDPDAADSGHLDFFRVVDSDGDAVFVGDCSDTAGDLVFNTLNVTAGAPIAITSWTIDSRND